MKILNIVSVLEPGGAQRLALLLSEGFNAEGSQSRVLFLYKNRAIGQTAESFECLLPEKPKGWLSKTRMLFKLIKAIRKEKPDVLVTHLFYGNVYGCLMGALAGVKTRIAVFHNEVSTIGSRNRVVESWLHRCGIYSTVVFVSKNSYLSYVSLFPSYKKRSVVIPNAVPLPAPQAERGKIREGLNVLPDEILVVSVGRLSPQKNHETSIKALKNLAKIRLVIVGDGELKNSLKALAVEQGVQDRVTLVGEISYNECLEYISSSDFFLMSSHFEGWSLSVIEAIGLARPLILSNIQSFRFMLEGFEDCVSFFDPTRPETLQEVFRSVSDRSVIDSHSPARFRLLKDRFSFERMIANYTALMPNR